MAWCYLRTLILSSNWKIQPGAVKENTPGHCARKNCEHVMEEKTEKANLENMINKKWKDIATEERMPEYKFPEGPAETEFIFICLQNL